MTCVAQVQKVPEAPGSRGGDSAAEVSVLAAWSRLDHPGDKVVLTLALACLCEEQSRPVCFLTTHTFPV